MDANSVINSMVKASIDLKDSDLEKGIRYLNNPDFILTGIISKDGQLYFKTKKVPIKRGE